MVSTQCLPIVCSSVSFINSWCNYLRGGLRMLSVECMYVPKLTPTPLSYKLLSQIIPNASPVPRRLPQPPPLPLLHHLPRPLSLLEFSHVLGASILPVMTSAWCAITLLYFSKQNFHSGSVQATDGSFTGPPSTPPASQYPHFSGEGANLYRIRMFCTS